MERELNQLAGVVTVGLFAVRPADVLILGTSQGVQDVADRVCHRLTGEETIIQVAQPSIVVAPDLTPSQTASFDRAMVLGFATEGGSSTAHTAILAQALGIPAVVGVEGV